MPLSLSEIEEIRDECLADDLDIDFERMSLWSADEARVYFESGGEVEPPSQSSTPLPSPDNAPKLPAPSEEQLKAWFPKRQKRDGAPKFRLVCFHNAGSAESIYTGRGMRQSQDNPFVKHCAAAGGELLCPELPGREQRRKEPRSATLRPYAEALFPVLAPLLQDGVPCAAQFGATLRAILRATRRSSARSSPPRPRAGTSWSATRWARGCSSRRCGC